MEIKKREYRLISAAVQSVAQEVEFNETWKAIHNEFHIGKRQHRKLTLSATDRRALRDIAIQIVGLDPATTPYEEARSMTRTQAAKSQRNEKTLSKAVRSEYLEVRFFGEKLVIYQTAGYRGMHLIDLVNIDAECVVTIENFDVFVRLESKDLPDFFDGKECIIIYRGDNKASPRAVIDYLLATKIDSYHFGDFDPKGVEIGLSMPKVKGLIIPVMSAVSAGELSSFSQSNVFYSQELSLKALLKREVGAIVEYIREIERQKLAVMQEHLIARMTPLQLLPVI